jgi:hypothetical protein
VLKFGVGSSGEDRHALRGAPGEHAKRSAEAMRHLTIVVPYREREAHLERFVPHVKAFFTWHKVHRDIPYRVLIVEQERGLPFNAGALRNIGFTLARDGSVASFDEGYTCFHDIDYLPMDADYRWSDVPTQIAWYGAETRPVIAGATTGFQVFQPADLFRSCRADPEQRVRAGERLFEHVLGLGLAGRGPQVHRWKAGATAEHVNVVLFLIGCARGLCSLSCCADPWG